MIVYLQLVDSLTREFNLLQNEARVRNLSTDLIQIKKVKRNHVTLQRDCLVSGSVECCHAVMSYFNVYPPVIDSYPYKLRSLLHRKINRGYLQNVNEGFAGFIKPATKVKLWTGCIIRNSEDRKNLNKFSRATEVYISEVVSFLTEWRFYVIDGKIRAFGNYDGDENLTVEFSVVEEAVLTLTKAGYYPVAYCLDFGVLSTGETALVEYNDAYAFGWYAEEDQSDVLFEMLEKRWKEILK